MAKKRKKTVQCCGRCGHFGHNVTNCPFPAITVELVPEAKPVAVVPSTGLLEAPTPPPKRERKPQRIDLSYLKEQP